MAFVLLWWTVAAGGLLAPYAAAADQLRTIDHVVPQLSTAPVNRGASVGIFVRERFQGRSPHHRPAVLMVHGATVSAVPVFDLQFADYSWMAYLAQEGFDVFAMDHTGYGRSSRPRMDDPCNTATAQQEASLIPHPLAAPCPPSYPFQLTTSQAEWDELDTVVEYIRHLRGVDTLSLIGYSAGGPRVGGYAARHPDKVAQVILYAPVYNRATPTDPPATLPLAGVPMTVTDLPDPGPPGTVQAALTAAIAASDPLGSTWGRAGVYRAPVRTLWGWNAEVARRLQMPVLLIRGAQDALIGEITTRALYEDVGTRDRVSIRVAGAGHGLVWEPPHLVLLRASRDWLLHGQFHGQRQGHVAVEADGHVRELVFPSWASFAAPAWVDVGRNPRKVVAGDVNGDGHPDLAVANRATNDVSILLGRADGRVAPAVAVAVGPAPFAVALSDVDGDGRLDLLTANLGPAQGPSTVAVLQGVGDGTFVMAQTFAVGRTPLALRVADVNRDGIPDLVLAAAGADVVQIALGRGDGSFATPSTIPVGREPRDLAVADIDGDGVLDVVTVNFTAHTLSVLRGRGDGTFAAAQTLLAADGPNTLVVTDLTGDGVPDLAVAHAGADYVSLWVGHGDGTFAAPHRLTVGPTPVEIAVIDLTGDGWVDVAVTSGNDTGLALLPGRPDGTFGEAQHVLLHLIPSGIAGVDLNGDGRPDLAVVGAASDAVEILLNTTPLP